MREPWVRCPNQDAHGRHWYTIRAANITFAGGYCDGASKSQNESLPDAVTGGSSVESPPPVSGSTPSPTSEETKK